jgi:hypothetical protein
MTGSSKMQDNKQGDAAMEGKLLRKFSEYISNEQISKCSSSPR